MTDKLDDNDDSDTTDDSATSDVPDGGWGWVVAFACLTINVIYDGCSYSFGILFVKLLDYFGDTKSNTALIGALFFSVPLLCGPLASIIAGKYGFRKATMVGGAIAAAGFAVGSFANSTWALCICYGVISGFGMSLPYFTSSVAVAVYFRKRLALAAGIAECGAGLGTVIFAPFTNFLISTYGWRGALLIVSGVVSNIIVCGALVRPLVRKSRKDVFKIKNSESDLPVPYTCTNSRREETTRMMPEQDGIPCLSRDKAKSEVCLSYREKAFLQHRDEGISGSQRDLGLIEVVPNRRMYSSLHSIDRLQRRTLHRSLQTLQCAESQADTKTTTHPSSIFAKVTSPFRSMKELLCLPLVIFTMSNFIMYFWYDVPYVFTVDRAITLGFSSKEATLLVSLIGIVHTVSNLAYGFIADKVWVNTSLFYGISIILCGASMFVVPLCFDYVSMALASACFGLFSAATETLSAPIIVEIVGVQKLNKAFGVMMLLEGAANLAGPPLAGL